ncbi:MAG: hypothetical protein ACJ8M4_08075 [Chthoniobacterales bacterium]
MGPSSKLIDLRQLLAERFPQAVAPPAQCLVTGIPAIDDRVGGGLPKNAITELTAPNPSAGTALLIHALLQTAHRNGFFFALVDGRDSFDPHASSRAVLPNLLWVRCQRAGHALQAADFLLRDGNFPLVVLDLVLNAVEELRKIPQTHWYRLQRLVEAAPTACLVLTRRSMISSAQLKVSLTNAWQLNDLEKENLVGQLNVAVDRVQGHREILARAG